MGAPGTCSFLEKMIKIIGCRSQLWGWYPYFWRSILIDLEEVRVHWNETRQIEIKVGILKLTSLSGNKYKANEVSGVILLRIIRFI